MKITLGKLKSSEQGLSKLSNSALPINLAFRISKLLKEVTKELIEIEEFRKKLVQKYGKDNGDGNISVEQENIDAFVQEFNVLLGDSIEIAFEQIKATELPPEIKLTPIEISQLEDFINFEE